MNFNLATYAKCIDELKPKDEAIDHAPMVVMSAADKAKDIAKQLSESMIAIKKMSIGELTKECTSRNIDLTGVKIKKDTTNFVAIPHFLL